MSNDPVFDPSSALPVPELAASEAENERAGDAKKVLDALTRMETAVQGDRTAVDRLRSDLTAMAEAIAQAKEALRPEAVQSADTMRNREANVGLLLRQLESRLNALMETVGAAGADAAGPSRQAAAPVVSEMNAPDAAQTPAPVETMPELDRVPTVSNVFSRLGRPGPLPASVDWSEAPSRAGDVSDAPTVSMLEAMVAELAKSVPDTPPRPEPPPEPEQTAVAQFVAALSTEATPEPAAVETVEAKPTFEELDFEAALAGELKVRDAAPSPEPAAAVLDVEPEALPEPEAAATVASDPPPPPAPTPSSDLMSSFARMQAIPYLRAEFGTAVIFAPRTPTTEPPADDTAEPEPQAVALAAPPEPHELPALAPEATTTSTPEAAAADEPVALAALEPVAIAPEPATTAIPEPAAAAAPEPADVIAAEWTEAIAVELFETAVPEPATATASEPARLDPVMLDAPEAPPSEPPALIGAAPAPELFGAPTPVKVETAVVAAVVVKEAPPSPAVVPEPAEAQGEAALDPDAILFGPPEPDPDPAAFLLDPAPVAISPQALAPELPSSRAAIAAAPPAPKIATTIAPKIAVEIAPEIAPKPEPASVPAPTPVAAPAPPSPPPRPKPMPAPPAAPYDPLAPLKTMSDEEKIALFS